MLIGMFVKHYFVAGDEESEFETCFTYDLYTSGVTISLDLCNTMELSRPTTPEAPPQDLWSSILDSVSSSRSIPSKQIVLLGQPSTGKSTLAAALLQKTVSDEGKDEHRCDFALGYDFADVRDDADEGNFSQVPHKPL